jgi:hypothetical protein
MASPFKWNSVPECSTLQANKHKGFGIIGTDFLLCSATVPFIAVAVEQSGTIQFVPFHLLRIINTHAGFGVEQGGTVFQSGSLF